MIIILLALSYLKLLTNVSFTLVQLAVIYTSVAVATLVSFFAIVYREFTEKSSKWFVFALILPLIFGFLAGVFSYVFVFIFSYTFKFLAFDYLGASLFVSTYLALVAYFVAKQNLNLTVESLLKLTYSFFGVGFIMSAIFNQDPFWWRGSFCSLGMAVNGTEFIFSFTLVFTALLLLLSAILLQPNMRKLLSMGLIKKWQVRTLMAIYFVLISMITIVGFVPYGVSGALNQLHVTAGNFIFYIFGIFLALIYWLLPNFSKKLYTLSYAILSAEILMLILYQVNHYFTTTIVELISLLLIGVWFYEFVRELQNITR